MNNNPEIDSLLQIHKRKMLRRAANRKSAQLSRARKKAHMEDLKVENARLQKVVDILESQPEILFTVTMDGRITYISDKTMLYLKSIMSGLFMYDELSTVNQILSEESVEALLKFIAQLCESSEGADLDSSNTGNLTSNLLVC